MKMTNNDRIYRICELMTYLIELLPESNDSLDWVKNEVQDIMNDIDDEWASGGE